MPNTFPTSILQLNSLQDPTTPSILDIRPFISQLKGRDSQAVGAALTQVQQAYDLVQEVLRSASPSLQYLSIDSADIGVLGVGNQFGPGVFTVYNGGPNFDAIGWIGSQPSASSVAITSIVAGLVTTGAVHGLKVGDNTYIEGTTDANNAGFYVVATTPLTTTYTVTGGVAGGNSTGGTSNRQFQGIWIKSGAIGGTAFNNAKLIADVDGSLSITDASIVLNGTGAKVTIDPVVGRIIIDGTVSGSGISEYDASGIGMTNGSLVAYLNPSVLQVGTPGPGYSQGYFSFDSSGAGSITFLVVAATGGGGNYISMDNSGNFQVSGSVNSVGVFKRNGTSGISPTRTRGTGVSVGTSGTGVFGTPGVGQSNGTVVTSVTLTTSSDVFSGGILTA